MQRFKSVYFAGGRGAVTSGDGRTVTIAFGPGDNDLFRVVKGLSSEEIRGVLQLSTYEQLRVGAHEASMSLNAFCLNRLRRVSEPPPDVQIPLPGIDHALLPLIDPIQVTFRGGLEVPLHDWYPYLEGYSPEFVDNVLSSFAPDARHVLDPFAGSGTTPLTVSRRGVHASYCELNPLLQFLIQTKADILALSTQGRVRLARELARIADEIPDQLAGHSPDPRLADAYLATFGKSEFFAPSAYETVLRVRSWLDSLDCTAPDAASVATVASVACLVPVSRLIRRGDLRFRKSGTERRLAVRDVAAAIRARLRHMAQDLGRLDGVFQRPVLVSGDAKRLDRIADLGLEAVMTSPPYLNGTNYYRNTKLELWFLRALLTGRDLAAFRRETVTAGINDVSFDRNPEPVSEIVAAVVSQLRERAYDRRIPQMVLSYFADMAVVFDALRHHMRPGAPLLLDIGDSAYAGVHVDTPSILHDLLLRRGWNVFKEVTLRRRLSRGGRSLRQVLLAARAPSASPRRPVAVPWRARWAGFKERVPHQQAPFAKRNWGSALHSLCSYQGKMKPSLAHHLVATFVSPGARVLDPFGGVGTIPFEAASIGAQTWSFDISPAAVPIAAAKLQPSNHRECDSLLARLGVFISSNRVTTEERLEADEIRFNGRLKDYFHPATFDEILLARRFFRENRPTDPATALVFACLLHILHGNRPYALSRRSHPITPFAPTGGAEPKSLVEKLAEKVKRALLAERPAAFLAGTSMFQDATAPWPREVDMLDAVITSPPFFDSVRFHLANWMRLWFAGWSAEDFRRRPLAFVDERQKRSFRVYLPVIRQARERLRGGGVCVLHLGKSSKCDMALEIGDLARSWFANSELFRESVIHCESHGIRDKGAVVEHTYLVLH